MDDELQIKNRWVRLFLPVATGIVTYLLWWIGAETHAWFPIALMGAFGFWTAWMVVTWWVYAMAEIVLFSMSFGDLGEGGKPWSRDDRY